AIAKGQLAHLATGGREISLRVLPGTSQRLLRYEGTQLRAFVTVAPRGGQANREVTKLLAAALGIAKTRLTLVRGHKARDKVFRVD
ncbi:MAG: DUF167 domain-containing protein, partial [Paracoccaceae bacterium]